LLKTMKVRHSLGGMGVEGGIILNGARTEYYRLSIDISAKLL
jgi:hypothetical protein